MAVEVEQILLRIYLRNADRMPHEPSWQRIVKAARADGLAGVTVIQGIMGLGSHGLIQESKWSLVEHVPIIVEIVDTADRIANFVGGTLRQYMPAGMATLERAAVMMYRDHKSVAAPLALAALLHPLSTIPPIQPRADMTINSNSVLVRVFIGESDRFAGKALHQAIIEKVRELGLGGATVLRGIEGFGAHSVVHKSRVLELSADLPIIVEIVDCEDKIKTLLPHLETMVGEGLITMEYVTVLMYREGAGA